MENLEQFFDERFQEIRAYLDFLERVEVQVRSGIPRDQTGEIEISPEQQKILYSSLYLQLYSLVESTVNKCVDSLVRSIIERAVTPSLLSEDFRKEWIRFIARTHEDLKYDKRLESAIKLSNYFLFSSAIEDFRIDKGGGGNWDDKSIYKFSKRLGIVDFLDQEIEQRIKRHYKNDQGSLEFIKDTRNKLAHGNISFVECSNEVVVSELRELSNNTALYLRSFVRAFQDLIENESYLNINHLHSNG
jgi:predicted RNA-binding protein with EMAP domain